MATLIDTHAHLYDLKLSSDITAILERIDKAGISHVCMPNVDLHTVERMMELHAPNRPVMIGLHPCQVESNWEKELAHLELLLNTTHCCAVGEIGLDYYWDTTHKAAQQEALKVQLQWALDRNLPVSLHTRSKQAHKGENAIADAIDIVRPFAHKGLRGVFHCFSGTLEEANEIISLGLYLGIGGTVTYKNNPTFEILAQTGLSNVVLETDSPYLSPVPHRGKNNEPAYIQLVAEKLAQLPGYNFEQVATITTQNAKQLFSLR